MEDKQGTMMTDSNKLLLMIATVVAGWLLYQLSPVLMPFLLSALLAYLADPIVDKLEAKKLSRTLSSSLRCYF
jgi:predicted PurR-regulated permease PerM